MPVLNHSQSLIVMFDDTFIERLFDLVELTRNVDDESLNYSVIKLIVRFCFSSHALIYLS